MAFAWKVLVLTVLTLVLSAALHAAGEQELHAHPPPEKLGEVDFPITCKASVVAPFERALALLHSFAYAQAEHAFRDVVAHDADCPIARWGVAMSLYHQLWEAPSKENFREGARQIELALRSRHGSLRERQFIVALQAYYSNEGGRSAQERADFYSAAMGAMADANPDDTEMQIFYALALIATAPPSDKTHAQQKKAIAILEPLYRKLPQHPGLAHYLIHACDSAELAQHGLAAARAYSLIAPSAPHALHMPSHIFTRLGLWSDSIASNLAARAAAHAQGDVGEELHAMDYLVYAYLQRGDIADAQRVVEQLHAMPPLAASQFKIGYAASAMPVRVVVEQRDWPHALTLQPLPGSPPHVIAVVHWARALGAARGGNLDAAGAEIRELEADLRAAHAKSSAYWAAQVEILLAQAQAWQLAANGESDAAIAALRTAADQEDAVEKLPVTPGPIVPAREQLGEMLLAQNRAEEALHEFQASLTQAPRRRGALLGAIAAAEKLGDADSLTRYRAELAGAATPDR